ncbi:terminase small subunit [Bacillus infantis]|uniref:terminase small subunit n=1 Tax=Bacillus infantis TaxID=324767 RepID=UPI003CE8DFB4
MSNAGRPLKFGSAEELSQRIQDYFDACDDNKEVIITKDGAMVEVPKPKPYTISGLAYFLGTNRQTLINYGEREEYFDTIRAAKAKIEMFVEESLWTPKVAQGVIFNLKNNFGWVDKTEVDNTIRTNEKLEDFFK